MRFGLSLWSIPALVVALLVAMPVVIIALSWGSAEVDVWQHLIATGLSRLLKNTLVLMLGVGVLVMLVGVSLAWLTAVCEFPGRRWLDWALILPLAVPTYVVAFVALGVLSALIGWLPLSEVHDAFVQGAKDMMTAALVIAFSKGIVILAEDGRIIDTLLYHIAGLVDDLPRALSVQVMLLVQTFLNFFMPSGSGQAALTMPIMAPLSDLLGISRQTAVLAFQFGDGLSNLIIPTSGVTMGVLGIARVPYQIWLRWFLPLFLLLMLTAGLLLIPPVLFFEYL